MSDGLLVFTGIGKAALTFIKWEKPGGRRESNARLLTGCLVCFLYFSLLNHTRNPAHQTRTPAPHSRSGFMSFLKLTSPGSTGPRPKISEVPDLAWGRLMLAEFQACSPARRLELLGESELIHLETLGCTVLTP